MYPRITACTRWRAVDGIIVSAFTRSILRWRGTMRRLAFAAAALPGSLFAMQMRPAQTGSGQAIVHAAPHTDSLAPLRHVDVPRMPAALRAVITDSETLHRYWMPPRTHGPVPVPAVDFSREMVLLAALGQWTDTGAGIRIDSVVTGHTVAGLTATVFVSIGVDGNGCIVGMAITHPADAVVIPRNEHVALIQFRERLVADSCPMTQWNAKFPKPRPSEKP